MQGPPHLPKGLALTDQYRITAVRIGSGVPAGTGRSRGGHGRNTTFANRSARKLAPNRVGLGDRGAARSRRPAMS